MRVADREYQASKRLADAADAMPGAFQWRLLQTVVDVAAEKNSTLVMPFPVELLRFFNHLTEPAAASAQTTPGRAFESSGAGTNGMAPDKAMAR